MIDDFENNDKQHIIAFLGKKQAGKNTACNFIAGVELSMSGILKNFHINDKGELIGSYNEDLIELDDNNYESQIIDFTNMYHTSVHVFSFAEPLKELCSSLLGLDRNLVYGTDEDKSKITNILWDDMPILSYREYPPKKKPELKTGPMTVREVLQYVGTEIFRKIKNDCWSNACINQIKRSNVPMALICDCRFPNEVEAVHNAGGHIIKLTKGMNGDGHASEKAIDDVDPSMITATIDNSNMTITQQNKAVAEEMFKLGLWDKSMFSE